MKQIWICILVLIFNINLLSGAYVPIPYKWLSVTNGGNVIGAYNFSSGDGANGGADFFGNYTLSTFGSPQNYLVTTPHKSPPTSLDNTTQGSTYWITSALRTAIQTYAGASGKLTFQFWYYADTITNQQTHFFMNANTLTIDFSHLLNFGGYSNIIDCTIDGHVGTGGNSALRCNIGEWNLVSIEYTDASDTVKLFYNGVQAGATITVGGGGFDLTQFAVNNPNDILLFHNTNGFEYANHWDVMVICNETYDGVACPYLQIYVPNIITVDDADMHYSDE